ncbi:SDR family NAD(P)-dependent oxidoreductase [Hydrocarboniphaga sp.]|uniref:SDR family NAD(P)-dependent oxidoreductase n=1 Tax=Hydrocarboniphaga sp. TaxID=2033016 RepID=UPI003D12EB19
MSTDNLLANSVPGNAAIYPSLRGKRVLITGGGTGIGSSIVEAFVRQQSQVYFVDIADGEARELEQSLRHASVAPRFLHCDLTDIDAVRTTISVIEADGPIDVLVNNAASDDRHQIEDVTPAYWDQRMAVNLRHLFFCAQAVVPGMKLRGGGSIINFGSISWHLALPALALYETAKAGIEGMTRALARDLGVHHIRVNCVVPGGIRTPRQMRLWHTPAEEERILDAQCLKERVDPHHVAAMALFLAADDARMCTGHSYFVDAGYR